jgi:hypothetical protein
MGLLTDLFTVRSTTARAWCRPTHRTNCFAITGGNSCCVCVPTTATCFVIEMWGQGGGGAGSCCCMGACWGGQGGSYAWVTCSTSGTNHILCACACTCNCCTPGAGLFTGSPGQLSRVTQCNSPSNTWIVAAEACGGSTCCNGMTGKGTNNSHQTYEHNAYHSNLAIQCCWYGFANNNWCSDGTTYEGPANARKDWFSQSVNLPFQQIQGTSWYSGSSCNCCPCFNFYVRGGCGWSSPDQQVTYATEQAGVYQRPTCAYCGVGFGRGGSAYAGGAGQCCDCSNTTAIQFGGMSGNTPGGGGSSASGTGQSGSCCLGSCGGLGVILISWS